MKLCSPAAVSCFSIGSDRKRSRERRRNGRISGSNKMRNEAMEGSSQRDVEKREEIGRLLYLILVVERDMVCYIFLQDLVRWILNSSHLCLLSRGHGRTRAVILLV